MSNAYAVIPLTFDSVDVQQDPIGIFLEIVRGLNEVPSVRGTDTVVPALAGRIARNREADTLAIELRGFIAGTGNEVQTVTITGGVTGGTFPLTYSGQTTAGIAWNATAAALVTALEALSNIAVGDVQATGGPFPTIPVVVTFTGALAATNVAQMTGSAASLTGGTPVLTIATPSAGGATDAAKRSHFRYLIKTVRALFDPRYVRTIVATLEDGTTATIAARTLNIAWEKVAPSTAKISIELVSVDPDWVIV